MAVIRLHQFLGEARAPHPTLLAEGVGTKSMNQKPGRGDLRPWKRPARVATVPLGTRTLYRMGRDVDAEGYYWLSWNKVVHAVRGFDPTDTTERTYYSGDGAPKVTDNLLGLGAAATPASSLTVQTFPASSRPLGLPGPATAPLLSQTQHPAEAGDPDYAGAEVTYFYCYTYVNDWGWESAPSPPSAPLLTRDKRTRTISAFASPPSGAYFINRMRIYRTQSGLVTDGDFYLMAEIGIGTSSYTEPATITLSEALETTRWAPPPPGLSNLTALWNGMLAGIADNSVRFCEAYVPYAWPSAYDVVPPDAKPVALGVFGQQLLVLTTGRPLLVQGSGPEAMDQTPLDLPQGCVAARSVVSMGSGVAWASEDGLCWYGAGGAKIVTAGLMTRDDWQALRPHTLVGQMFEGLYFGSYDDGSGRKGFFIDPSAPTGIFFYDTGYEAMFFDELKDQLYVYDAAQSAVSRWDAGASATVEFSSKVYRLPQLVTSFAAAEVVADAYPVTLRVDALGMDAGVAAAMAAKYPGAVTMLNSTALRYTVAVQDAKPLRLPSGFAAQRWQLSVVSEHPVQAVGLAHSLQELSQV